MRIVMSNEKSKVATDNNLSFGEYLKERRTNETDLTRAQAADLTTISPSRFEKIERGLATADAQDIVELARVYKMPDLCNYYCANECPIGTDPDSNITTTTDVDLAQIVISLLNSVNKLDGLKERLIEISADGKIEMNEYPDLYKIESSLQNISEVSASLSLWIRKRFITGEIDEDDYNKFQDYFGSK